VLLAPAAGCGDTPPPPPEEEEVVVVVLQSDLEVPRETDGLQVAIAAGAVAPQPNAPQTSVIGLRLSGSGDLPAAIGIKAGPTSSSFSMTAQLLDLASGTSLPGIVVSRSIADVRFVPDSKLMLVVPMLRACACEGTSCPLPGNPDCDNIIAPTPQPFDPAVVPPGTSMPFGTIEIAPPMLNNH